VSRLREAQHIPASYLLDSTSGQIDIFVHKSVAPTPKDFDKDTIEARRGRFQIPGAFIPPSVDHPWGFGEVFITTDGPTPDWVNYKLKLPAYTSDGTDWDGMVNTNASLKLLFDEMNFSDF
jgi:hypothetical protein